MAARTKSADLAALKSAVIDSLHEQHQADPGKRGAISLGTIAAKVDQVLPYLLSAYGVFGGAIPADVKPFADFAVRAIQELDALAKGQPATQGGAASA